MSNNSDLMAFWNDANDAFAEAEVSSNTFPPEGLHDCTLVGLRCGEGEFWDSAAQNRIPCKVAGFTWEWVTPVNVAERFTLSFQIVPDYRTRWPSEDDKPHKKARMNIEQLKDCLSKLTGRPTSELSNLGSALTDVQTLVDSEFQTVAQLESRKSGNFTNIRLQQVVGGGPQVLTGAV